jgi:hypothetical protein
MELIQPLPQEQVIYRGEYQVDWLRGRVTLIK